MLVPGLGISTTTGAGSGTTDRFGGTSSATPLVAGITALTISANPELSAREVVAGADPREDAVHQFDPR